MEKFRVLPDTLEPRAENAFSAISIDDQRLSFRFAASSQLELISWINVLVRSAQGTRVVKPVPLIHINKESRGHGIRELSLGQESAWRQLENDQIAGGVRISMLPPAKYFPTR